MAVETVTQSHRLSGTVYKHDLSFVIIVHSPREYSGQFHDIVLLYSYIANICTKTTNLHYDMFYVTCTCKLALNNVFPPLGLSTAS